MLKCHFCNLRVNSAESYNGKRENCVPLGLPNEQLPISCWRHKFGSSAVNIITAVPVSFNSGRKSGAVHEKRVRLAKLIILANNTVAHQYLLFSEIIEEFSKREIETLLNKSDKKTAFYVFFEKDLKKSEENSRLEFEKNKSTHANGDIELPENFKLVIEGYRVNSLSKLSKKEKQGKSYSIKTVKRKVRDAMIFLKYVYGRGLCRLEDISQEELDEYAFITSNELACRVFTFLNYLKFRLILTNELTRPRIKTKPVLKRLIDDLKFNEVYRSVITLENSEEKLIALLLIVYAQKINGTILILSDRFKIESGGVYAKFNEIWILLTKEISCLVKWVLEKNSIDCAGEAKKIFRISYPKALKFMSHHFEGESLKNIRTTAVANLINAGVIDRVSISRALGVSLPVIKSIETVFQWDRNSVVQSDMVKARNKILRS